MIPETHSTSSNPVSWATDGAKRPPQTGFFLFQKENGPLIVHEPADRPETGLGRFRAGASSPTAIEPHENSSMPAKRVRIPRTKILKSWPDQRYILLKKYEGFVTGRTQETFSARLSESRSNYPEIEAEFDLEELSEIDRNLVVKGAQMVWTIGYSYAGSTRKRESLIYLRRLPPWTDSELEQGMKAAEDLTSGIRWE